MTGFEPATLCSQNRCATKLRYIPNILDQMVANSTTLPHRMVSRLTKTRECSSMVEPQSSKLITRVRFPSLAPLDFRPKSLINRLLLAGSAPIQLPGGHQFQGHFSTAYSAWQSFSFIDVVAIGESRPAIQMTFSGQHDALFNSDLHQK